MLRPILYTLLCSSPFLAGPQEALLPHLAWGDFDGDGLDDLAAVEPTGRLRLYKNQGAGALEEMTDVSGLAGLARSASWQDVDRDHALDLLLVRPDGSCSLYRNQGAGQFVDATGTDGLERARACTQASWVDYDGDGNADLELVSPQGVELWRNDGRGAFEAMPLAWSAEGSVAASSAPLAPSPAQPGEQPADPAQPTAGPTPATQAGAPEAGGISRSTSGYPHWVSEPGVTQLGSGRYELPGPVSPICGPSLEDEGNPGSCVYASSDPTLGMLFPLGQELFVSATGQVGMGTLNPRSLLHVKGPGSEATLRLSPTSNDGLSKVILLENNNADPTLVGGVVAYDGAQDVLRFSTLTAGVETTRMAVERLTGDVGIGTTNPVTDLHVVGAPNLGSLLIAPNDTAGNKTSELVLGEDTNGASAMKLLYRGLNDRLEVSGVTGSTETPFMTVERTGHVGIGTTTPSRRLHVVGTGENIAKLESSNSNATRLEIVNTDQAGHTYDIGVTGSTASVGAGKLLVRDVTANNTARLLIDSAGNVGINTFFPAARLDVVGDARFTGDIEGDSQLGLSGDGINGPDILMNSGGNVSVGGGGALYSNTTLNVRGNLGDELLLNVETRSGDPIFQVQEDMEVWIDGDFAVTGFKNFVLDHPLDPANKSLAHNAVEGPGCYTFYRGNVVLDGAGEAWVELPDYFDALNADASYQLTCIGAPAPVYVADEARGNRFRIAGGYAGLKVSWQVTAVRDDPWARAHPYRAEIEKTGTERGRYYYPEGYGMPHELGIGRRAEPTSESQASEPEPQATGG